MAFAAVLAVGDAVILDRLLDDEVGIGGLNGAAGSGPEEINLRKTAPTKRVLAMFRMLL